jgi:hypothetical protein
LRRRNSVEKIVIFFCENKIKVISPREGSGRSLEIKRGLFYGKNEFAEKILICGKNTCGQNIICGFDTCGKNICRKNICGKNYLWTKNYLRI